MIEVAFEENIGDSVLETVEKQGDNSVGIINVADKIVGSSPEREIELLSELEESLSGSVDGVTVEYNERGFSLDEELDLREGLHLEGEVESAA